MAEKIASALFTSSRETPADLLAPLFKRQRVGGPPQLAVDESQVFQPGGRVGVVGS